MTVVDKVLQPIRIGFALDDAPGLVGIRLLGGFEDVDELLAGKTPHLDDHASQALKLFVIRLREMIGHGRDPFR
jgi:hypothetical protein